MVKLEASRRNFQQSLDLARPIISELVKSDEGILVLATDYGALGKKEELKGLVASWQSLSAPSDEASLELGDVLLGYGMEAESKQIFEAEEVRIAAHPSPAVALKLNQQILLADSVPLHESRTIHYDIVSFKSVSSSKLSALAFGVYSPESAEFYHADQGARDWGNPRVIIQLPYD